MFTIIWLLPTVLSMIFFKIIGKKFNTESYIEANALSIFSVITLGFIFLLLFMLYSNLIAEPKRTAYFAMVYYNQWYPLAIIGALGALLIIHRVIKISRLIVKAKLYQTIIIWGVGTHTLRLLETSRLGRANIVAFVDSNPRYQLKQLNGIPIIAPADLKSRPEPILISSRVFQREIEQQIREDLRLSNQIVKLYAV
jgi:FlaA1/EpsC-like NDP-sugar epimerase